MKNSASCRPGHVLTTDAVERLARQLVPRYSQHPAGAAVRRKLQALERNCRFTPRSRQLFEQLLGRVGVASTQGISLPISDQPFWFRAGHPLANYQSAPTLPSSVDVLIIGAGLTGASAAYHLGPAVRDRRLHVAVIDRGDPATEASGRNGGNFELLPENSVGLYGGLARERLQFLLHVYPSVPIEVLRAESERQASLVLGMALRNRDRLQQIIGDESIDCDFSPRGWIYLAHTDSEEQGMCECTYGATSVPGETPEISTLTLERMISRPGSTIKAAALRAFPLFADFSDRELRQLLRLTRRWDLPRGTVAVSEGGPGGSCFIIVGGSVDVTVRVRGRQQLLAQLPAGSIFGQVSLISGEARTATCSMPNDSPSAWTKTCHCRPRGSALPGAGQSVRSRAVKF